MPHKSEQRLEIERLLLLLDKVKREHPDDPRLHGARSKLAMKFRVSRGRITNIARGLGLTEVRP